MSILTYVYSRRSGASQQRMSSKVRVLARTIMMSILLVVSAISHSQEISAVDLSGVWSTNSLDVLEDPAWDTVGHFSCACTAETYELLRSFLNDPANDQLSAEEIVLALEAHTLEVIEDYLTEAGQTVAEAFDFADDPAIQCEPFEAFRTVMHADPIEFTSYDDRIVITGEDLTSVRTVYLNSSHPESAQKTSAGHAIGWFEGRTFVVETVNVAAGMVDDQLGLHHSEQAIGTERYTLSEDGNVLNMIFTLDDPVMLKSPLVIERPRVLTPGVALDRAPCETIAGEY
ncbi:MAG: hypothetical protein HOM55_08720 [Proteobacteria bacterium]|jgi:hypothetical protein|nr:hypothetical protein [Pseudomonadota bacterium]